MAGLNMTETQKPPFRAEHVGSLLRPQELKDAFRDFHAGRMTPETFREIQDRCIREAVAMQEKVGLQSITDGEFRRGSWFMGFIDALEGLTTRPALFDFHDEQGHVLKFQAAYVDGKLERRRGITTDEFSFIHSITKRTPKVTIPTPSILHFYRGDDTVNRDVYPDIATFWSDLLAIYRAELDELGKLGCTYVQLDEVACAMLCDPNIRERVRSAGMDPEALLRTYIDATNRVVDQRPAGMAVAVHLCRGNYKGHWMAVGGYEPIAEELFNELAVDAFFLEYDSPRAGGFEPLRFVPKEKRVVLGLISTKTAQLESLDDLKRRVDDATRYIAPDQLAISPQCGFASSAAGNPLTIENERRKLRRVVEAAEMLWS